jgi:hypothetical protein
MLASLQSRYSHFRVELVGGRDRNHIDRWIRYKFAPVSRASAKTEGLRLLLRERLRRIG